MKKKPSAGPQITPIIIGLFALIIGVLLYQIDRPSGSIYFLNQTPFNLFSGFSAPGLLGDAGQILPGFIHVFAFSLITAGLFASNKKEARRACYIWFGVNAIFEIGQKFGKPISAHLPKWWEGNPCLESIPNFFSRGTFDWKDLIAMAAGALSAWIVLARLQKK